MKLFTLIENTTADENLVCEHGLSLYIEVSGQRILFDAGQTGAFADNAEKMGVDLTQVDLCILSHGHYDHGGGIKRFLEVNDHAKVYVSQHAFGDYYNAEEKYIGLDWELLSEERIVFVRDNLTLSDTLSLHTCPNFPQVYFTDAYGMQVKYTWGKLGQVWRLRVSERVRLSRTKTICSELSSSQSRPINFSSAL